MIRAIALLIHTGSPVRCQAEHAYKFAIVLPLAGTFIVKRGKRKVCL